jgi:predicted dehydrogenase
MTALAEPRRPPADPRSRLDSPILVAGLGSIGRRHLSNLRGLGAANLAVYRTGRGGGEAYLPDVRLETDLLAALERRPAAVVVCNPTALHVPLALEAARAGCALLIEKPLSHSLEGVLELAGEIEQRRLVAMPGFQFRFHPTLRQVRQWIALGEIGEVVSIRAHWGEYLPGWHPDEDYRRGYSARRDLGGGVILTLCHPFDYMRWLVGDVVEVTAMAARGSGLDVDVEDTAHVALRFASGALGSVSLDYSARPPSHELQIIGRNGRIHWTETDGVAWLQSGAARTAARPPRTFDRNTMFVDEIRHFLACVAGEAAPVCRFEDGLAALRVALAAKRAATSGRSVDV